MLKYLKKIVRSHFVRASLVLNVMCLTGGLPNVILAATLPATTEITSTHVPDVVLLNQLRAVADEDGDGKLLASELASYDGELDLKGLGITDIRGLGYLKGVRNIDLRNNNIEYIPVENFLDCTNLESIQLPDTLTNIHEAAFDGCTSLNSINLPENLLIIEKKAFNRCSALTNIVITDKITSLGEGAFLNSGLTSVTIPNANIMIGEGCFNGAKNLISVNLPEGMTNIPIGCFSGTGLTTITIPTSVRTINAEAFKASELINIDLSKCTNLTEIREGAFTGTPLQEIKLPESLTILGERVFENCTYLKEITIPSKIVTISNLSFANASSLETINFTPVIENGKRKYSISKIGYKAFMGCDSIGGQEAIFDLSMLEQLLVIEAQAFYDCRNVKQIKLPANVIQLGDRLCSVNENPLGTSSLQYINIPNKVESIGVRAFYKCDQLQEIDLSSTAVRSIGQDAFYGCKSLGSVKLSNMLESIDNNAFYDCANKNTGTGVSSIIMPDTVTSIGTSAFKNCYYLEELILSEDLATISNNAFENCESIASLTLPSQLEQIGSSTFKNCKLIPAVNFPDTLVSIGASAFDGCTNLSNINFSQAKALTSIGASAFRYTSQKTLRWPETVTTINTSVFEGNVSLENIYIPDTVTSIGSNSFKACYSLNTLDMPASTAIQHATNSSFNWCLQLNKLIARPVPTTVYVNENSSIILPVKVFSEVSNITIGDESYAISEESVIGSSIGKSYILKLNGVKEGETTVTVEGVLEYQIGSTNTAVHRTTSTVTYNVIVSANRCTSVNFTEDVLAYPLATKTKVLVPNIQPADTTDMKEWSSSNESVMTVDANGKLTFVDYGTAQISLRVGSQEAKCTVNVCAPASSLKLDNISKVMTVIGEEFIIVPTLTYSSTYDAYKEKYPDAIVWTSSNPSVAVVNQNGTVTAKAYGQATITAQAKAGSRVATCLVKVSPNTKVTLSKTKLDIVKGQTDTLSIKVAPSDSPLELLTVKVGSSYVLGYDWQPSSGIITLTGKTKGNTTVTVTPLMGEAVTCAVSVKVPLISITTTSMELNKGATRTITLTKEPTDTTDTLIYTSKNTNVATVSEIGRVQAINVGTTEIVIQSKESPSVRTTCLVTVVQGVTGVVVSPKTATIEALKTVQLTATVTPEDATNKEVVWTSSNTTIATVDAKGLVKGIAPGTATITAKTASNQKIATSQVTVTKRPIEYKSAIENPIASATVSGSCAVKGWYIATTPITKVEVLVDNKVVGTATRFAKPSVTSAYPTYETDNAGFTYALDTTKYTNGSHTITVKAYGEDGSSNTTARQITVSNAIASTTYKSYIESPTVGATITGSYAVKGWYIGTTPITKVEVLVDNKVVGTATRFAKPSVTSAYPAYETDNAGFTYALDTTGCTNGVHSISIRATGADETIHTTSRQVTIENGVLVEQFIINDTLVDGENNVEDIVEEEGAEK